MTLERLQLYNVVVEQIELIKREYIPSYISGVDTSKVSIQNNSISDLTADTAIQQLNIDPSIKEEYVRLRAELSELNAFIFGIDDELIRAIVIRRFIVKEKWENIANDLHYTRVHCARLLKGFLDKNLE